MASCTAQDTSNAHTPGSDTRGRAFNWPAWQEAFAHAEGLKQIAAETRRAIGSAPQGRTGR